MLERSSPEAPGLPLAEHVRDWVFRMGPQGEYLYCSPVCGEITGYDADSLAADSRLFPGLVHPEDRDAFDAHIRAARSADAPVTARFRIVARDGEIRWIEQVCRAVGDETVGSARDVTEQHRMEVHFRRAQEVASLGSWDLDLSRDHLYWSDEVYRIFGIPPGTPLDYRGFLARVHEEDRDYVDKAWRAALAGAPYDIEHRILVEGKVKWVREKAEVEFNEAGRAVRGIGVVQDVTARREAAEEATRLHAALAHVKRVATLSELSATIAHELNQPLAAILSNAQAALRFLDQGPDGAREVREILEDIVRDDQRARDVILRLREMTTKPRSAADRSPMELNGLVEGVLRIARGDQALKGVVVFAEMGADLPLVSANAVELQQAILNLVLNALDAMEESPERRLTIRTRAVGSGTVEVAVADTGPGLDPSAAEKLFDPFFTTKKGGMGMGLAITRAIVEAHEGMVRAESDDGGARFVVSLPALEPGT